MNHLEVSELDIRDFDFSWVVFYEQGGFNSQLRLGRGVSNQGGLFRQRP